MYFLCLEVFLQRAGLVRYAREKIFVHLWLGQMTSVAYDSVDLGWPPFILPTLYLSFLPSQQTDAFLDLTKALGTSATWKEPCVPFLSTPWAITVRRGILWQLPPHLCPALPIWQDTSESLRRGREQLKAGRSEYCHCKDDHFKYLKKQNLSFYGLNVGLPKMSYKL